MDLNLVSIVYLFYRLAPFIIVCFFTLNSIINQDLRGLMYLSGLLILISVVFITSSSWLLLPLLFVNIILMGYFGLIKFLDIFKPFKIIYDAIQVILRNLIFSITTIVLVILIVGSYALHFYEFNKIDNIDRKLNNEDTEFFAYWFYYRLVKFFKFIDFGFDDYKNDSDGYCMEFSINGSEIKKPLSACIYGFTYGYLMFYINKYDLIESNIPIVTLFPLLIVGDLAFQKVHKCRPSLSTNIVALFLGVSWGVNWGDIVASMKNASLQYFVGGNQPACSVPSSQNFVCNVYKNGQLIATQMNKS
jgi:hypothetical protein